MTSLIHHNSDLSSTVLNSFPEKELFLNSTEMHNNWDDFTVRLNAVCVQQ